MPAKSISPFCTFFPGVQNRWYEGLSRDRVANGEVQMVALRGLLKDKLTFKGNKWGKMPAR